MSKPTFSVVVRPEGAGDQVGYVAQCLEVDICVQGSTLEECQSRFIKAVRAHCIYAVKNGEQPFDILPKTPDEVVAAFSVPVATTSTSLPIEASRRCEVAPERYPRRATFAMA